MKRNHEAALFQFLADYDTHRDRLLQSDYYHGLTPSDNTVWTVWDATLERIEAQYYPHARLLPAFLARLNRPLIQDERFRLASLQIHKVYPAIGGQHPPV